VIELENEKSDENLDLLILGIVFLLIPGIGPPIALIFFIAYILENREKQ
jgi:hypothetical protein